MKFQEIFSIFADSLKYTDNNNNCFFIVLD